MVDKRKLLLSNWQSPGDLLMLTATVRDLHKAYPDRYLTDVRTSADALWQYNPYLTKFDAPDIDKHAAEARDTQKIVEADGITYIPMMYPDVNRSNQESHHFIEAFHHYLEGVLSEIEKERIHIPLSEFRPDIHVGQDEKCWINQVAETGIREEFWIINTGGKWDYTAKWPNPYTLQKIINHFRGKLLFVQVGDKGNWQPQLTNVVDMVGATDLRQLIRLMYHASGIITPVNGLMHLAAAIPSRPGWPDPRACVVLAGGREPTNWEAYPTHRFLSTQGDLPCCNPGACWKSRCTPVGDSDDKDRPDALCLNYVEYPTLPSPYCRQALTKFRVPKCLDIFTEKDIIRAVEGYYEGGSLQWPK